MTGVLGAKPTSGPSMVRTSHCKYGTMMYFPHDTYIGVSLEKYGAYSEEETDFLCAATPVGGIVVEVGANIGCMTVPLAQKVGPAGHVLVFEPQRVIHQMLCGNLAINGLWNVSAERMALGAEEGIVCVPRVSYHAGGNFGAVSMQATDGESVPIVPLDKYHLPTLHLLKIDVEGMELDVLRGATETINKFRPLIYCENDRPEKSEALLSYLTDTLKYDLYQHWPMLYTKDNYRACEENVFPNTASMNVACIPHERAEEIKSNLPLLRKAA